MGHFHGASAVLVAPAEFRCQEFSPSVGVATINISLRIVCRERGSYLFGLLIIALLLQCLIAECGESFVDFVNMSVIKFSQFCPKSPNES